MAQKKGDNTVILVLGGLGLLWLWSRSNPSAVAAQQNALANAAALQSQSIAANTQAANIQTGANLLQNLVGDFTN